MDTNTTNVCYKVVECTAGGHLVSIATDTLPRNWGVEYTIGQPAYPSFGKLFAYTSLDLARDLVCRYPNRQVYEAIALNPRPIKWVLPPNLWIIPHLNRFWATPLSDERPDTSIGLLYILAGPGTIIADAITLVNRIL
jgi:hypothetical protein